MNTIVNIKSCTDFLMNPPKKELFFESIFLNLFNDRYIPFTLLKNDITWLIQIYLLNRICLIYPN